MRGEIDDGRLIERRERVDERIGGILHFVRIAKDAGARVDHDCDAGGLGRSIEVGDFLRDSIIENAKIRPRVDLGPWFRQQSPRCTSPKPSAWCCEWRPDPPARLLWAPAFVRVSSRPLVRRSRDRAAM